MYHDRIRITRLIILLAVVLCCALQAAGAETWYVENEWNYLETSMDISNGIPEDADGALARIRRNGVLRIAADFESAPMNFLDPEADGDNRYAGVDMELARLIAEKMAVKLQIVPMQAVYKLPALIENQCDLTISAVPYTPANAQYYTLSNAYTQPEEETEFGIIIREEDSVTSLDDLKEKIIVTQSSSDAEAFAVSRISNYREFRRVPSPRAVFDMVRNGQAFAGIIRTSLAELYFENNPGHGLRLAELGKKLKFDPKNESHYLGYRVAAKKGETKLIAFVNGVIAKAAEEGKIDEWHREAEKRAGELGLSGK